MAGDPNDYLCALYFWWAIDLCFTSFQSISTSVKILLSKCKYWANPDVDTGDERFKTMNVFVKKCLSKRRAVQKLCCLQYCPFRSPENGRHVLIKFNAHVADKFGKKSVDAINAKLQERHAADLNDFILTQRPLPIPIGCILSNSALSSRFTLEPKDTADESFQQELLALISVPQSPTKRTHPDANTPPRRSIQLRKRTRRNAVSATL